MDYIEKNEYNKIKLRKKNNNEDEGLYSGNKGKEEKKGKKIKELL